MRTRPPARPRRRLTGALARLVAVAALAVTGLITVSGTPALASAEGQTPGEDGACARNIRTGNAISIYDSFGVYYGWAEMRIGNSGSCWGYQWVQLWIQRDMKILSRKNLGQPDFMMLDANKLSNPLHGAWFVRNIVGAYGYVKAGRYTSRVLYAPFNYDIPVCGTFAYSSSGWGVVSQKDGAWGLAQVFFGTGGVQRPFCA